MTACRAYRGGAFAAVSVATLVVSGCNLTTTEVLTNASMIATAAAGAYYGVPMPVYPQASMDAPEYETAPVPGQPTAATVPNMNHCVSFGRGDKMHNQGLYNGCGVPVEAYWLTRYAAERGQQAPNALSTLNRGENGLGFDAVQFWVCPKGSNLDSNALPATVCKV